MYKFPLRIPPNRRVLITQGFHNENTSAFYIANGLPAFHDAIDVVTGTAQETYGTPFVCPFPEAKLVAFDDTGEAGTQKADRVQVRYVAPDGTDYLMGGLHFSELVKQDVYKEGDVIGYLGNSGYVLPAPDANHPYDGSHIHLSLRVNNVVVDPSRYFNQLDPYIGEDTGPEKDKTKWGDVPKELRFKKDLYRGMTDPDVKRLQEYLIESGYSIPAGPTRYFGPQTMKAVGDFQIKQGIVLSTSTPGYGRLGPKSRANIG